MWPLVNQIVFLYRQQPTSCCGRSRWSNRNAIGATHLARHSWCLAIVSQHTWCESRRTGCCKWILAMWKVLAISTCVDQGNSFHHPLQLHQLSQDETWPLYLNVAPTARPWKILFLLLTNEDPHWRSLYTNRICLACQYDRYRVRYSHDAQFV